ncbi:nucleoside triphosphate pyrophosphohydrolase [bacterium]|jgi:dephospho-CoA kinase|nr:nucleoside triphosphate pyrophosphohydrolase [bacterium]
MTKTQPPFSNTINAETLLELIETIHRLRAPGGCPWDQAQTHQSLRQYLIEESFEVIDVIDQIQSSQDLKKEKLKNSFQEELGDVFMQVLLHSEMAREVGAFDIFGVARSLNQKLISRHPHVFGDIQVNSADQAIQSWEKQKAKEKAKKLEESVLDGVPKGLPILQRSSRVIEKVTRVGFQWNDMDGPISKLEEELEEFKKEILLLQAESEKREELRKKTESELGDLLFTICNLAYLNQLNPENALRGTIQRFERRFRHVEKRLKSLGKKPEDSTLDEMNNYWDEAKKLEKVQIWGITGGIASGKTTVAEQLRELGLPVVDADLIAHELLHEGQEGFTAIMSRFGTVNRDALREIVFNDNEARKDLEAILHPLIYRKSIEKFIELAAHHRVIFYEAALLIESGRYSDLNGLIVIESDPHLQIERTIKRKPIDPALARKIIESQVPDTERVKHADFILKNDYSLDHLKRQVIDLAKNSNWID